MWRVASTPPYSFKESLGNLISLTPPPPSPLFFFQATFSQTHLPSPSSQGCLLHFLHVFVPPVIVSCNRHSWCPLPIILHHHLFFKDTLVFLSGGEQNVTPSVPETLPLSLDRLVPLQSSVAVLLLGLLAALFPVYCASWQAGLGAFSALSFACFLYSLTCSGSRSSSINVL